MSDKNVIKKIKKLLALAKDNANPHERDRALEAAHKLLAQHNLEMSTVESSVESEVTKTCMKTQKMEPWSRVIWGACGNLYYTTVLEQRIYKNGRAMLVPVVVGRPDNIAVTCEMAAYLMNSIKSESRRWFDKAKEIRSFRMGAAHMIYERVKMIRQQEAAKAAAASSTSGSECTALARLHDVREAENEQYLQDVVKPEVGRAPNRQSDYSEVAAYAGMTYGSNLKLQAPTQK